MSLKIRFYIGFASFLFLLGTVGGLENDLMSIGQAIIFLCIGFTGMVASKVA